MTFRISDNTHTDAVRTQYNHSSNGENNSGFGEIRIGVRSNFFRNENIP